MANALNLELEGQYVILRRDSMKPQYQDLTWRVFHVTGGFGAYVFTIGGALFGTFVRDGERARMEGDQVERLATPEEVEAARQAGGLS